MISMALTPWLSNVGDKLATIIENSDNKLFLREQIVVEDPHEHSDDSNIVVVCGFGNVGESIMKIISSLSSPSNQLKCKAFDLDPNVVVKGFKDGFDILYGDGTQPSVLRTAGIEATRTKAFVITYYDSNLCLKAVEKLRVAFPQTPIISRVTDISFAEDIYEAGATFIVPDERETSFRICQGLLQCLGVDENYDIASNLWQSDIFSKYRNDNLILPFETDGNFKLARQINPDTYVVENNQVEDIHDANICILPSPKENDVEVDDSGSISLSIDGSDLCILPSKRK